MLNELKGDPLKKSIQTASYLPHFLSSVIVTGMIKEMLAPDSGIINVVIKALGGTSINFLLEAEWFHTIYIGSGVWQHTGFAAIIYIAAFSSIDAQIYEAAMVDGAGKWGQMVHVTLPGIAPAIIITLILSVGDMLSIGYEKILLLYNAMVYETADVIQTYVYRVGLTNNSYSYATAIGLFESVIALVLVTSTNYLARKISDVSLW